MRTEVDVCVADRGGISATGDAARLARDTVFVSFYGQVRTD